MGPCLLFAPTLLGLKYLFIDVSVLLCVFLLNFKPSEAVEKRSKFTSICWAFSVSDM